MRNALIIGLLGVLVVLLDSVYRRLRDYLAVKHDFILWPDRTERLIRSSRRKLRKLNQEEDLSEMRHLFTLADGNEKGFIEEYCRIEDTSVNEFLRNVAVEDANSWKTMRDELELIFGSHPPSFVPLKTTEDHLNRVRKMKHIEAIFFHLPVKEYNKVSRHLARGCLSERYIGRLAVAVINQRRAATDESALRDN